MRQSVTTHSRPVSRAQSSTASPSRRPAPQPRAFGQHRGEAEEARARRKREALVIGRHLDRAGDRRADHLVVPLDDEGRESRVVEVGLVLGSGVLDGRQQAAREDRRERLVRRQRDIEPRERVQVLAAGKADDQARRPGGALSRGRRLPDRVDLLMAEAEPEPRVDERVVGSRQHRVVQGEAVGDPAFRGRRVEVPHELGADGGVAGRLDPHVRPPARVAGSADDEACDLAVHQAGDTRRAVRTDERADLLACQVRILVPLVEAGLDEPVRAVALGEQDRGAVQVLLRERHDVGRAKGGGRRHTARVEPGSASRVVLLDGLRSSSRTSARGGLRSTA